MENDSFFLVVEGLDGSGKSEIASRLEYYLRIPHGKSVLLTFEPDISCCAGLFIRQVLKRWIKCSTKTLALAFAANRADHCAKVIEPHLDSGVGRIVVCDRYYLSSLVYQMDSELTMEKIMEFNSEARRPDLTVFLDASVQSCLRRMKIREQEKELFERNLGETRAKYYSAIDFLRNERHEQVELIPADGSVLDVLQRVWGILREQGPSWLMLQPVLPGEYQPKVFSLNGQQVVAADEVARQFEHLWQRGPLFGADHLLSVLGDLRREVTDYVRRLDYNSLGSFFLEHLRTSGYELLAARPWTDVDAFDIEYCLPLDVWQRGLAVLCNQRQPHDLLMRVFDRTCDFVIVFDPLRPDTIDPRFERETVRSKEWEDISASVTFFTLEDLANVIFARATDILMDEHLSTISAFPDMKRVLSSARQLRPGA
jgi:dTMP kinase